MFWLVADFILNMQTSGAASSAATVHSTNKIHNRGCKNEKMPGQCSLSKHSLPLVESQTTISGSQTDTVADKVLNERELWPQVSSSRVKTEVWILIRKRSSSCEAFCVAALKSIFSVISCGEDVDWVQRAGVRFTGWWMLRVGGASSGRYDRITTRLKMLTCSIVRACVSRGPSWAVWKWGKESL